jgi:hypothetical protein
VNGPILAALRRAASHDTGQVRSAKKKKGKSQDQTCVNTELQRCSADAAACRAQVFVICGDNAECIAETIPCCDPCSADAIFTCLLARANSTNSRSAVIGLGK